jgi:16S rRNA (uracil1498-N3)-methyltransferase
MSVLWAWAERVSAGAIGLTSEEARHVAARRLRVGDPIVVFDGQGHHAEGSIESLGKASTVVHVESIVETPRPDARFVVASAIPKADRLSTMLQMMTQLGVAVWQPLLLDESVAKRLDPEATRLVRILTESCKVARRAWRLEASPPRSLEETLARHAAGPSLYFGDREGTTAAIEGSDALVLIGPEAGFSEAERRVMLDAGAMPRSFAPYNLRIETAVVAAAAIRASCAPDGGPR